jgi:uncharacterized membrane protein YozB (DUF420 family)
MEENKANLWLFVIAGSMVAGAVAWGLLTSPQGTQMSPEQVAAQARARAIVETASMQELQSKIVYIIPAMVGLGAFLLWKKGQEESSRWSDEW